MNKKYGFSFFLIIAVTLISYSNNLHNDFIWDDEFLIEKNSYLQSFTNLPKMLISNSTAGFGGKDNFYRPTQNIFYLFIYQAFGQSKVAFHLGNILLHLINGVLIFLLIQRLWARLNLSLLTSLLWISHPTHTEAITYISGTADPMGLLFFLLASLSLPPPDGIQKVNRHALTLVFLTLSLISKEAMVVGPSLLMLIYFLKAKYPWRIKTYRPLAPAWILVGAYLVLRKTLLNFDETFQFYKTSNVYTENIAYRVYTFASTLPEYLKILAWPTNLHMERNFPVSTEWSHSPVLVGFVLVLMLTGYSIFRAYKKKDRTPAFLSLWFFIAFVPMSGIIIPVNSFILEHWLYLSSITVFVAVALLITHLINWKLWVGWPLAAALVLALTYNTRERNKDWRTPITFYNNILSYTKGTARVHNNLAMAYSEKQNWTAASMHYQRAIKISDTYPQTHYNLARVYIKMEDYPKALQHLNRSLEIDPQFSYATKLKHDIKSFLKR